MMFNVAVVDDVCVVVADGYGMREEENCVNMGNARVLGNSRTAPHHFW